MFSCELHFLDLKTFQSMFACVLCRDLRLLRVTADSTEILRKLKFLRIWVHAL